MLPEPYLPKLRPLDVKRISREGQPYLLLRDPLGLREEQVLVHASLGPLLALCDGTRDPQGLAAALELTAGVRVAPEQVAAFVGGLSEALVFDDHRFAEAMARAREEYRSAPFRKPALAGKAYPEDPEALAALFGSYCQRAGAVPAPLRDSVVGVLSPHIDYQRGGPVYAAVWQRAARAVQECDLVVVFGTDHAGGPGRVTLTRQSYATPWGVLPTSQPVVERLAEALGEEAFLEEVHHRNEHSIELALTWLHYFLRPRICEVVPVLCGSFQLFVDGAVPPGEYTAFQKTLDVLRDEASRRRVLVVAAADLAHVGPAFGDPRPWGFVEKAGLRSADERLLQAVGEGDAESFFQRIRQEGDRRRICGMPPIYLTLKLLEGVKGETAAYDQCIGDAEGGSWVSVAGAVLLRR